MKRMVIEEVSDDDEDEDSSSSASSTFAAKAPAKVPVPAAAAARAASAIAVATAALQTAFDAAHEHFSGGQHDHALAALRAAVPAAVAAIDSHATSATISAESAEEVAALRLLAASALELRASALAQTEQHRAAIEACTNGVALVDQGVCGGVGG